MQRASALHPQFVFIARKKPCFGRSSSAFRCVGSNYIILIGIVQLINANDDNYLLGSLWPAKTIVAFGLNKLVNFTKSNVVVDSCCYVVHIFRIRKYSTLDVDLILESTGEDKII